jgi:hypothetical protein
MGKCPHDTLDMFERHQLVLGHESLDTFGHTITASNVACIRHGDAQRRMHPPKTVYKLTKGPHGLVEIS